jgi:hypothetical protein
MEPDTSLLFLKTRRLAPIRRCLPSAACQKRISRTDLFLQQPLQFLATVVDALAVRGIHYPNERVGLLEVVLPIRPECLLASDIPLAVST